MKLLAIAAASLTLTGTAAAAPAGAPGEIVFVAARASASPQVRAVQADGTGARRLPVGSRGAAWFSPDGSRVVVSRTSLTIMRVDGSDVARLRVNCAGGCDVGWSPDGGRVAYSVIDACGSTLCESRLVVVNADGSGRRLLLRFRGATVSSPVWAPDGKAIVFVAAASGVQDLNLVGANGKGFRRLAPADGGTFGPDYRPVWTNDGARILFSAKRAGTLRVLSVARNGTDLQTLATGYWPTLSGDGKRVAFVADRTGYVAPVAGGTARRVARAVASPLVWSPDGTRLAYVEQTRRIRVARANGRGSANVTAPFRSVGSLDWIPA